MQKTGRYNTFVAFLFLATDLLFLNIIYIALYYFFVIDNNLTYQITHLLVILGYIASIVGIKPDVQKKMHLWTIVVKNFYRLIIAACIVLGCLFATKMSYEISRLFIFTFFGITFIALSVEHWCIQRIFRSIIAAKKFNNTAIILGAGLVGRKIYKELTANPYMGISVLGFFDDNPAKNNGNLLGNIQAAKAYAKENTVNKIYCTLPLSARKTILDFLEFSENNIINFHIVPSIGYYFNTPVILEMAGNMPVFSMRKIPLSNGHNAFIKRCCDVVVSFLFLTTLFPVIYLVLGIAIKLSSSGPVFFIQERTGKGGKSFKCYKFRSMRCNNEAHKKQATANDPRKTRVGNFLRRTNFDELPQFINVLKGDMSIVGPRPHMLLHTEEYSQLVQKYMVRHFIKPGITGYAQINGFRGETREVKQMAGRIKKDIWYIEHWSLALDVEIIVKTIFITIRGDKKAY